MLIGALFTLVTIRLGADFLRTMRLTSLLLLISEGLVLLLTVARRRAVVVDRSWDARLVTGISLVGAPLLNPDATLSLLPNSVAARHFSGWIDRHRGGQTLPGPQPRHRPG